MVYLCGEVPIASLQTFQFHSEAEVAIEYY